jgi:GLPGLI family protein
MKTAFKSLFVLAFVILAFGLTASAQTAKSFKGVITMNLSYTGNIDAATLAQQPKLVTIKVMGNKQKMSMAVGPVTIDVISNGDAKETITLIDMMGQKKYYKTTSAEIEAELAEQGAPEIIYLDESKTIAGYNCKKALYITDADGGGKDTTAVYYSEELGGLMLNYGSTFQGLKGFALEYVIKQQDIITTFSASEVKKNGVKDTDFMIPTDYVELTPEEKEQMKAAFKGGE